MKLSRVIVPLVAILLATSLAFGKAVNFTTAVKYSSGGPGANAVVTADVNNDGTPDIVIATNAGVSVSIGLGDGTFNPSSTYSTGSTVSFSNALAVTDLNGDGNLDIAITNMCLDTTGCHGVGVLLGNGDGTFQSAIGYDTGGLEAGGLAAGDVNGDGLPDLIVVNNCQSQTCVAGTSDLLLNNGDGTFGTATQLLDSKGPSYLADMNGDGSLDVVTGAGIMLNNGDGTFQPPNQGVVAGAISITVADVNNDGLMDVVAAVPTGVAVQVGNGDGTLQPARTFTTGGKNPLWVAVADFNGDNRPDLAVVNECSALVKGSCGTTATVGVLPGNGDGTFGVAVTFNTGGNLGTSVAMADLDLDGKPDLVATNACTSGTNCNVGSFGVLINSFLSTTTVKLTFTPSPALPGQNVTLTAVYGGGGVIPDGSTVLFFDNGNFLDAPTTVNGVATTNQVFTTTGTHMITVEYDGDLYHTEKTQTKNEVISHFTSVTTVTSNPNPSTFGQSVTITATVATAADGGATGNVTFFSNGKSLKVVALVNGVATYSTTTLALGTDAITTKYYGDSLSTSSTGATTQTVN
jgi:hypothetical protein